MGNVMKKLVFFILILSIGSGVFAQHKYALVIGNAVYTGTPWGPLTNPVNDANSMEIALKELGFTVDIVRNGTKSQMELAVFNYRMKLSSSRGPTYGFFYYAGHGAQNDGENFLIPVEARTPHVNDFKEKTVTVSWIMEELQRAKIELNLVVLDACRDFPRDIKTNNADNRGGEALRGLAVTHAPQGSIVMYATAAGESASDGGGKNGLFTSYLLNNLKTPGLEVTDVFRRTMGDVERASGNKQRPAYYNQYSGMAYLGSRPVQSGLQEQPLPLPAVRQTPSDFVRIEGGTFTMGSPRTEANRDRDETQHQVKVSSFYMSTKEVTLSEYLKVMQFNPNGLIQGANLPVIGINWYNAIEYCNARSLAEGLTPAYTLNYTLTDPNNLSKDDIYRWLVTWDKNANGYRLPTEAEWEYACRAGTTTAYSTGASITDSQAVYRSRIAFPVGSFTPNKWGLYDMHGNIAEWCWDWYGEYETDIQTDPSGPVSGKWRVARGGSWRNSKPRHLRSAYRLSLTPTWYGSNMGIRLVRSSTQEQPQTTAVYPNYSQINAERRMSWITAEQLTFTGSSHAALNPAINPSPQQVYRLQVGAYRVAQNAAGAFERLKNAGLNPAYERYEEYLRVVLPGIRGTEVYSLTEKLGAAGFREALVWEER
jgi:formylglycine-generating enzyme required for sulfatase activity